VSYGSGSRLSAKLGSGIATCPMSLDLTSQLRWAPALPHVLWLRTSPPPDWCELQRCHLSHGSMWAMSFNIMKKPSKPSCVASLACSQRMRACLQGTSRQGHHAPARRAGRQYSQYLQGVWTCIYNVAIIQLQCNASTMDHSPDTAKVPSDSTTRHHTTD
jgi:hypothetical protein